MHLHAIPVDFQGPPPHTICAPFNTFPVWDPRDNYADTFGDMGNSAGCDNPIVSRTSNDQVMRETLAILEAMNIIGVTSGPPDLVQRLREEMPKRIIPGLSFDLSEDMPSPETIRNWYNDGKIAVLGEVTIQYQGIEADDSRFEPYLAIAEQIDLPIGIHIGTGPPGAPYLGFTRYRARMHSPLSLEEPLLRHPGLRVYVMHAGWPMLDDTLALMYVHPQVYVDVGVISYILPRAEFHRYLRGLVEAGFANRVMFGSDQMIWPATIQSAIESIETAEFLSPSPEEGHLL